MDDITFLLNWKTQTRVWNADEENSVTNDALFKISYEELINILIHS